jgi:hypothetical protein
MAAMDRRSAITAALGALLVELFPRGALAAFDVAVPVPLQMDLLLKVAGYDRNLPARARGTVRLLILTKRDDSQSKNVGEQAARALAGKDVKGMPTEIATQTFNDGPALTERVRTGRVSILYAAPGFGPRELLTIARSLEGLSVLSSGALAHFVDTAVALGFDLVSGKPKLIVNVRRAREQGADLSSQVLRLAKVIE